MRIMKKTIKPLISLSVALLLFAVFPTKALASNESFTENGLVSIEVIPNSEMDSMLPENLYSAIVIGENVESERPSRGIYEPDSSSIWNLETSGQYSFTVNTSTSTIYSNYVFTGHGGEVKVHLVENTATSGKYTFKLHKRGLFNTTLYTYRFDHGTEQTITMGSFSSNDKIYFSITPGGLTQLTNSSYIKKN